MLEKHLKFLLCILSPINNQDIKFRTLWQSKMPYLLARDAKVRKCYFCFKNWLFTQILKNSDFRPCVTGFHTHQENLKSKYKRFWVLLRKIYFHIFLQMLAFGVELMTVSLSFMLPWVLWNRKFSSKADYVTHIDALFYKICRISKFKKCHKFLTMISIIKVTYLPKNTTSRLQPLDVGVIPKVKVK